MQLKHLITASLEGSVDGKSSKEIEYMFFAKLTDFAQLKKADSVEEQEQWEIRTSSGCVRTRATTVGEKTTYVMTSKVKVEGELGKEEVELEVSEDMFRHFKAHATSGMRKLRFCFNVPDSDLVWEIDVFPNPRSEGQYVPWVKIDLEVPGPIKLPEWPIEFERVILEQNGHRSEDDEALVQDLFSNYYIIRPSTKEAA